jgi:dolichol-phosphate mannosyltransferase
VKKLVIVVLAFNEVESLNETVSEIIALELNCLSRVVISTSKAASPRCLQAALELSSRFDKVEVYFQNKPFVAAAVMEVVSNISEELCVYMSADRETPVNVIPVMLHAMSKGDVDIVSGSRWIPGGSFSSYGWLKFLTSYFAQLLCRVVYRSRLTEFTYGYRMYRTEVLKQGVFRENKHPFFLESLLVPLRLGSEIVEVPVKWERRTEASSMVNTLTLISYLRPTILVAITKKKRLRVSKID